MTFSPCKSGNFYEFLPRGVDLSSDCHDSPAASDDQAEEINVCRIEFLHNCGFDISRLNQRYERLSCKVPFIIRKLPNIHQPDTLFALLSDRKTLFSDAYADFMENHDFFKEQSTSIESNPDQRAEACAQCAWDRYISCLSAQDKQRAELEREDFLNGALLIDQHRRAHRNSIDFYQKELFLTNEQALTDMEAPELLKKLQSWIPDIPISEEAAIRFSILYFADYFCSQYSEDIRIKKEAGHFRPAYTAEDYTAFLRFREDKSCIAALFEQAKDWLQQHDSPLSMIEQHVERPLDNEIVDRVYDALKRYLQSTRSTVTSLSIDRVRMVLQQACVKTNFAPFRFMVSCVVYSGAIFSCNSTIELDTARISSFSSHVYRKRPSIAEQRTSRLKLLLAVCAALQMSPEDINSNLLFFLRYHGFDIRSNEERDIWEGALSHYGLLDSPCSLALHCYHHLTDCMPLSPSNLYCYQAASQLHLGGFMDFSKKFSDDLTAKSSYIPRIPGKLMQLYLKNWGSEDLDICAIQEVCQTASASFKETASMNDWIEKWDYDSRNNRHKIPRPIDRKELRALSLEYAVQRACVKQAQEVLLDKLYELAKLLT